MRFLFSVVIDLFRESSLPPVYTMLVKIATDKTPLPVCRHCGCAGPEERISNGEDFDLLMDVRDVHFKATE